MFSSKPSGGWSVPILLFCFVMLFSGRASASFTNFIYMTSPCSHGKGETGVTSKGTSCSAINVDHPTRWGVGQKYGPVTETLGGLTGAYVSASGAYRLRMYWCNGVDVGGCTMKKSVMSVTTAGQAYLQSSLPVSSQNADFGGGTTGTVPDAGSMCFTLIAPNNIEWGVAGNKRFCSDSSPLPVTPTECAINYGSDLNIDFGNIERATLPTSTLSASGNKKLSRAIPVTCSGDASIMLSARVDYTAALFNQDAMMTSNENLAVAIIHNGAVFRQGDKFNLDVTPGGVANINLDFVAIRNASVQINDMATGYFSAHSTLILTEV